MTALSPRMAFSGEWPKILATVFAVSLALALAPAGVFYADEIRTPFWPWLALYFAMTFPFFLLAAVPFHLYARKRNITGWRDYVNAGAQMGAVIGLFLPALLTNLFPAFVITSTSPYIVAAFVTCGLVAGTLCSWTFWAFVVARAPRARRGLALLWLLTALAAAAAMFS